MRIYISVDMESISALERVHEITPGKDAHDLFCKLMAGDANAVVAGAISGGATDVVVTDGHARMTNIDPADLDPRPRLNSRHGRLIQSKGISPDFDAVLLVGYHSRSGPQGVLSHTFVSSFLDVRADGVSMGEAGINSLVLHSLGVPVIFLSGDDVAIAEARAHLGEIEYVKTKRALSRTSAEHLPLDRSRRLLRDGAKRAVANLRTAGGRPRPTTDEHVTIEIDLATSSADAMPPDALQRNARFVDSSETAELSDFELALGMGFVSPSRTGTIAIEGPLT